MTFRDDYRAEYEATDKSWAEFVESEIYHESELSGLTEQLDEVARLESEVEQLSEQVEGLTEVVRRLQRELFEANVMDSRDP